MTPTLFTSCGIPRHPPTKEATAVKPWRNAQGGVLRSLGEGGHASADVAEETRGTTAVKPWGSTLVKAFPLLQC